ncbi:hypothetical protein ACJ5NV_17650 [Loktanella agnita]|uniref:hypothetical protein n=1 Tax=Loktanella agnita TaxID=287097 RepID=UPI0039898714
MADPWWLPGCQKNVEKIGGTLCTQQHCTDSQNYWHAVCNCQDPYPNGCRDNNVQNCCSYEAESPVYVIGPEGCYCCCGCFASDTQVAFDEEDTRIIADFKVGDMVYVAMDRDLSTWDQLPVEFSSGTNDQTVAHLIQVHFGEPENPEVVLTTRDQLFMVQDGRLKRASRLIPEHDHLTRADGSLAPILSLSSGVYKRGLHHISTSSTPTTDVEGHLMIANGVVVGDYSLQITDLGNAAAHLMVDGHDDLPEFGTQDYDRTHVHLESDHHRAYPKALEAKLPNAEGFDARDEMLQKLHRHPVDYEHAFFTKKQAHDIFDNAPRQPNYSSAGKEIFHYLQKLFAGFYPSIDVHLDDHVEEPNAYSVYSLGRKVVVVNGGLIRTNAVGYEGLAFIIGRQMNKFQSNARDGDHRMVCNGEADYDVIPAVFPYIWFGHFGQAYVQPAMEQVFALFDFIKPDHAKGILGDTCNGISIECRKSAIEASLYLKALPECAGGPPIPTLEVVEATVEDSGLLRVQFNEPVDPDTATMIGNYEFAPLAPASLVELSDSHDAVLIDVELKSRKRYVVHAVDILSKDGHPLVESRSSASFKVPHT